MRKLWADLTAEDKEYLVKVYRGQGTEDPEWTKEKAENIVSEKYEVTPRTVRNWFRSLNLTSSTEPAQYVAAKSTSIGKGKYFAITWAQNATPVHKDFLENVKAYLEFLGGSLHVILGRYKNPTSVFTDIAHEEWATEILPYSTAKRSSVKNYEVLSNIRIQPTAVYPLSGTALSNMTGDACGVVGHPKVHFEPCPVLMGKPAKYLMTTGSCTLKNYTDSKAGAAGEFDHCIGFLLLEVDSDGEVHPRQIVADSDTGSFYDLLYHVSGGEVTRVQKKIPGIVLGDIHAAKMCPNSWVAAKNLLDYFQPSQVVLHDVFDGESISHHRKKDFVGRFRDFESGRSDLGTEIELTMDYIKEILEYNPVIVAANHNDWLDRWLNSNDWRQDLQNAKYYADLLKIALSSPEGHEAFASLVLSRFEDKVEVVMREDSYTIEGVEVGQHGDIGIHGSRGNIKQYKKLGSKVVVGDYHKGCRLGGVIGVGVTAKLRQGYNKGASAWNHAHCIIHPGGKRQLIIINKENYNFTTINYEKEVREEKLR